MAKGQSEPNITRPSPKVAATSCSASASCVMQSGVEVPYQAVRLAIAECLQLLVHLERRHGQRVVTQVVRVRRYLPASDTYELMEAL